MYTILVRRNGCARTVDGIKQKKKKKEEKKVSNDRDAWKMITTVMLVFDSARRFGMCKLCSVRSWDWWVLLWDSSYLRFCPLLVANVVVFPLLSIPESAVQSLVHSTQKFPSLKEETLIVRFPLPTSRFLEREICGWLSHILDPWFSKYTVRLAIREVNSYEQSFSNCSVWLG